MKNFQEIFGNFRKYWNKFPDIFRRKFLKISELTTLSIVQGSGFGPVLFVVYTKELAELLVDNNVGVKLFADDLKMYAKLSSSIVAENM